MTGQPIDTLPLWTVYPITVVVLLAAIVGGYFLARWRGKKPTANPDNGVGAISGATLALFAFLLAFVVGFAVNVSQERRGLLISEVNAIGTTYLRAGYLEEPYRTDSRDLLRQYVDWRVKAAEKGMLEDAISNSEDIQKKLWTMAESIVTSGSESATTGLYVSTLNEVIDLHTERVIFGLQIRVPPAILLTMYLIGILAMVLLGMQIGYGKSRSLVALFILVLVLAAVLYLITDLDRSGHGLLQISNQPMIDLQEQIGTLP